MQKRLDRLAAHYVVCGAGRTGRQVIEELMRAGQPVVVIERQVEALDRLIDAYGDRLVALCGDATEDSLLRQAAVERAAGLVTTLETDRDNLFVSLSARQLNPSLRIVSRGSEVRAKSKLERAGADSVVNPAVIGGQRMAHELLRPNIVGFLDFIGPGRTRNLCLEEVLLPEGSPLVGKQLSRAGIRRVSNALVLAVLGPKEDVSTYNPSPDFVFAAGMTLIVLGEREAVERLRAFVANPARR